MKSSPSILPALVGGALLGTTLLLSGQAADWWPFGKPNEQTQSPININNAPINRDAKAVFSLAPLVKQVTPSVVNISINRTVVQNFDPSANPFFNDPFFRRFFTPPDDEEGGNDNNNSRPRSRSRQETSLGSGVIISKDGYILTNNHVVEPADVKGTGKGDKDKDKASISVLLPGSKKQYPARIIGRDPKTDVALIKIDAKDLTAITLADSDQVETGDMVMAIGNPLGVGQTVTSGIVSARNRTLPGFGIDYQEFIQTDAAINPGNSGGALVDMEGRLIGLNTAIISRTGGNQGIGFAVPVNTAKFVLEQLLKNGRVIRGYLGLRLQELDADLASELKIGDVSGAMITDIESDGPSSKSDLKPRDVIIEFQGKKVIDVQSLRLSVSQTAPGTKVSMKVLRDGKEKSVEVTLQEVRDNKTASNKPVAGREDENEVLVGVNVDDLTDATRRQFNISKDIKGALIVEVEANTPAADAGLKEGEVIQEVGRQPVTNARDCVEISKKFTGDKVLVRIWDNASGSRYVLVKKK